MMALFPLGSVVATSGVLSKISRMEMEGSLRRHQGGDWGEVEKEDQDENDLSLREGFRILSVYTSLNGVRFWIITEADRSSTTILLPEEY